MNKRFKKGLVGAIALASSFAPNLGIAGENDLVVRHGVKKVTPGLYENIDLGQGYAGSVLKDLGDGTLYFTTGLKGDKGLILSKEGLVKDILNSVNNPEKYSSIPISTLARNGGQFSRLVCESTNDYSTVANLIANLGRERAIVNFNDKNFTEVTDAPRLKGRRSEFIDTNGNLQYKAEEHSNVRRTGHSKFHGNTRVVVKPSQNIIQNYFSTHPVQLESMINHGKKIFEQTKGDYAIRFKQNQEALDAERRALTSENGESDVSRRLYDFAVLEAFKGLQKGGCGNVENIFDRVVKDYLVTLDAYNYQK